MKRIIGRKAEWLKGDGLSYIRTNINKNADDKMLLKFRAMTTGTDPTSANVTGYPFVVRAGIIDNTKDTGFAFWWFNGYGFYGYMPRFGKYFGDDKYYPSVEIEYFGDIFKITANGTEHILSIPNYSLSYNYVLLEQTKANHNRDWLNFFEIENKIKLSPIQLSSSLPAYLASDNKPHAAGECGMWDSVNEKFYGNANTSGAFSVENELDEYVEVDLTGICINGKYQRVAVENTEIPQIVWNGVNARMLMLNGKVVWDSGIVEIAIYDSINQCEYPNNPNARINTDIIPLFGDKIYIDFKRVSPNSNQYFGKNEAFEMRAFSWGFMFMNGYSYTSISYCQWVKAEINYNSTCDITAINNTGNVPSAGETIPSQKGKIGTSGIYFMCNGLQRYDIERNGVLVHSLKPCKLLSAVNEKFCFDGQKHYKGECGYIDVITNKMYFKTSGTLDFYSVGSILETKILYQK